MFFKKDKNKDNVIIEETKPEEELTVKEEEKEVKATTYDIDDVEVDEDIFFVALTDYFHPNNIHKVHVLSKGFGRYNEVTAPEKFIEVSEVSKYGEVTQTRYWDYNRFVICKTEDEVRAVYKKHITDRTPERIESTIERINKECNDSIEKINGWYMGKEYNYF